MRGYAVTQPLASLKGKLPPQRLKGFILAKHVHMTQGITLPPLARSPFPFSEGFMLVCKVLFRANILLLGSCFVCLSCAVLS